MIGFIGLGAMGKPMALHVLRERGELAVESRSRGPIDELVAAGARHLRSPEIATQSDVIVLSLPGPAEVRAVVLADDFLDAVRPGSLVIDTSTVEPGLAIELSEALSSRGAHFVDAPVSGGQQGAIAGDLSAMVGGAEEAIGQARPILETFCARITHVGPSGAGQLTKAANQIIVATNIGVLGEAVALLAAGGVDLRSAFDAIGSGLAGSEVLQRKSESILNGTYEPGFRIDLHVKDLRIALAIAAEQRTPLLLSALTTQLMISSQAHGEGDLDHSALVKTVERIAAVPTAAFAQNV